MASRNHRFGSRVLGGVRTGAGTGSSPQAGSASACASRPTPGDARAGACRTTSRTGPGSFRDRDDGDKHSGNSAPWGAR